RIHTGSLRDRLPISTIDTLRTGGRPTGNPGTRTTVDAQMPPQGMDTMAATAAKAGDDTAKAKEGMNRESSRETVRQQVRGKTMETGRAATRREHPTDGRTTGSVRHGRADGNLPHPVTTRSTTPPSRPPSSRTR